MTTEPLDPGTTPGSLDDLVETGRTERLTTACSFHHKEDALRARPRSLEVEVGGKAREEAARHRDDARVAALALCDEQPPLAFQHVGEPETRGATCGPSSTACTS